MKFAFAQSSVSVAVVAILGFSTSGVVVEAKKDVISLRGGKSSVALAANEMLNNATSVNNTSITSVAVNSTTPANTSSVVTEISTNETSSIVEKCTGNTPGWTDIEGDGCEWYETFELPGCPLYGDFTEVNTTTGEPLGTVANDNCCHCFGTAAPSLAPTLPPLDCGLAHYSYLFTDNPTVDPHECTGSNPDWVDDSGKGCDWYNQFESPGCPDYRETHKENTGGALDNCCICKLPIPPTPAPTLSSAPSVCTGSTPGWVDAVGRGCDYYELNDAPGCPKEGDYNDDDTGNISVANDNCCHCFGTGAPTAQPTSPCTGNTPNWTDIFGYDCTWYEKLGALRCSTWGTYEGEMGSAKDNCCFCKMV